MDCGDASEEAGFDKVALSSSAGEDQQEDTLLAERCSGCRNLHFSTSSESVQHPPRPRKFRKAGAKLLHASREDRHTCFTSMLLGKTRAEA